MKRIILVLCVFTLIGCEKENSTQVSVNTNNDTQIVVDDNSKKLSSTEAKNFAVNLLRKINDDEKFLLDAYALKEQQTLEKYSYDVQAYMQPNPQDFSDSYWVNSEALAPYTKCDTALRDLQLYAEVLSNQLKEDSAISRKLVRKEEEDYKKSKSQCEKRVNMSYEQALAADNAE